MAEEGGSGGTEPGVSAGSLSQSESSPVAEQHRSVLLQSYWQVCYFKIRYCIFT